MTKRKMDCSLDNIVMEHLKKAKCEKTSKMFGKECSDGNDHSKLLENFIKFMKQKGTEKETRVEDDLGFEINFEAFQPIKKLSFKEPFIEKTSSRVKKGIEKRREDVPKEFIKKIRNLGMKVEDAEVLFKSRVDWTAVYSENKIYCAEPGCDYFTKIDNEELTNHMINVHEYGDHLCQYDHCDYVAYSKKSLSHHGRMHKMRTENNFWHKCLKPNCHSTFAATQLLDRHMRIHNNDLDSCQFCPYRYVEIKHYNDHLNRHFGIKAYKCDHCGLDFFSRRAMVEHASSHEGIKYYCLICKTYESTKKAAIKMHLRYHHSDLLGTNINWDSVKQYVKSK